MGIQPWQSRYTAEAVENPPEISRSAQSEAVIEANTPVIASSSDVSSMDWTQLQQTVSSCQLCELHSSRSNTVFGVGNQNADLLIVGESPGADEDLAGEPFVGHAGQLLDAMLKAIDLDRQQVYITNILKCQPPGNRNPHVSETLCCDPYLQRQIALIQPKLILALGRIAAHHLLVSQDALGKLRERVHNYNGIPLLVSYHPAYLLRKPMEKRKSWQDLLRLKQQLASM
ncbi:MAG: uracil-DNA glycosylase [Gammaproteobacteria bacterium]